MVRFFNKTLGCTSPILELGIKKEKVIFIADGKFHMEGAMIANPKHVFFKYHPYEQVLHLEKYDFELMVNNREKEICKVEIKKGVHVGIIQGILGRQGSPRIVERIKNKLIEKGIDFSIILVSEIFPDQMKKFKKFFNKFF